MKSDATLTRRRSAAQTLLAILDLIADDEMADEESPAAVQQWAQEQCAAMHARIAETDWQHPLPRSVVEWTPPLKPEICALSREEVLARIELLSQGGAVQIAYRKLTTLTDEDLRLMLVALEAPKE